MRKFELASIPVKDFSETNRKTLVCYLQYDRRRGQTGYWLTWLPIELNDMGNVTFCVSAMVTTPVSLIESGKRFSRRKLESVRDDVIAQSQIDNSRIRTLIREAYLDCCSVSCKDWNLPDFNLASLNFANAKVANESANA